MCCFFRAGCCPSGAFSNCIDWPLHLMTVMQDGTTSASTRSICSFLQDKTGPPAPCTLREALKGFRASLRPLHFYDGQSDNSAPMTAPRLTAASSRPPSSVLCSLLSSGCFTVFGVFLEGTFFGGWFKGSPKDHFLHLPPFGVGGGFPFSDKPALEKPLVKRRAVAPTMASKRFFAPNPGLRTGKKRSSSLN